MREILREILFDDWEAKLFSLLLAFVIWLFLSLSDWTISETKINVPINFTDLPSNMTVLSTSTGSVEVFLKVPRRLEEELKKTSPELDINLSEFKTGQIIIPVKKENIINIPKGVEISRIKPSSIALNLDRLVEKFVIVEPSIQGELGKGKIDVNPKQVRILCPNTLTPIIKKIPTEMVDIEELRKNREIKVSLLIPDPRIIVLEPKSVKINLEEENF